MKYETVPVIRACLGFFFAIMYGAVCELRTEACCAVGDMLAAWCFSAALFSGLFCFWYGVGGAASHRWISIGDFSVGFALPVIITVTYTNETGVNMWEQAGVAACIYTMFSYALIYLWTHPPAHH